MGITIANSTGDSGAAECDFGGSSGTLVGANLATQGLAVSYPASSPQVTGVGGTAIPLANPYRSPTYWGTSNGTDGDSALSYIPEQVWNDDAEIFEFCQQNAGNSFCTQGGSTAVSGWVPIQSARRRPGGHRHFVHWRWPEQLCDSKLRQCFLRLRIHSAHLADRFNSRTAKCSSFAGRFVSGDAEFSRLHLLHAVVGTRPQPARRAVAALAEQQVLRTRSI